MTELFTRNADANGRLKNPLYTEMPVGLVGYDSPLGCFIIDDTEVLDILISNKLDLRQKTLGKDPILHRAIRFYAKRCALRLLEAGADYTQPDEEKYTPLYLAASHNDIALVNAICDKTKTSNNPKALLDAMAHDGGNALCAAVQFGYPEWYVN